MDKEVTDEDILLGRHYNPDNQYSYWQQISTIDELEAFCAEVFLVSYKSMKVTDATLGAHMLLRQFISELVAIKSLLNQGATEQCNIHLRAMFELALQIEYSTESDTVRRGMHYNLMFKLKQLSYFKKLKPKSEAGRKLSNNIKKDSYSFLFELPKWKEWEAKENELLEFLSSGPLKEYYMDFKRQKKKPKNWYSFENGPLNLEQLSIRLGYPALYDIVYRDLSAQAHGEMAVPGKIFPRDSKGQNEIKGLREFDVNECIGVCNYAIIFCQICLHAFIPNVIPEKKESLESWKFNRDRYKPSLKP